MSTTSAIRNVHLAAGLIVSIFLLAYGLSAVQMAYPIYRLEPTETVITTDVPRGVDATPRALAGWLMEARDLRGDLTEARATHDAITLSIVRPGTTHHVEYDPRTRSARVTTRALDAVGMLNRIHHVAGIRHDYWAVNAWGWSVFAVSLALLVLAATGVVLWFVRHDDRLVGTIVMSVALTWGLSLLILIRSV